MEVIINNKTLLTVKDQDGNVLFQHIPYLDLKGETIKPISDEDKKYIDKKLRELTALPITATTVKGDIVTPKQYVQNSIQGVFE